MDDVFFNPDDNTVAEIATEAMRLLKVNGSIEKVCSNSAYWISLQRLYVVMIRNKEITRLSDLDKETKARYWAEVGKYSVDRPRWVKISMCQAVYLYELLNKSR